MRKVVNVIPEEQHFTLSSLPPSPAQKRLALGVVLGLFVFLFAVDGPLANVTLGEVPAFVPVYATTMFVTDSITAVLLFAQFSILRSRAMLVIAAGYLFTALLLIPWLLTFPGVFAPRGLLGGGLQSTAWFYTSYQCGFPIVVIAYTLIKDTDPAKQLWQGSVTAGILSSVALSAAGVCAITFVVTAGDPLLPRLMLDTVHLSILWYFAAGSALLLFVLALIALWLRRHSVLDMWLMVVMCAHFVEICVTTYPVAARYSVGWYGSRICGIVADSILLFVLLYEITLLYSRLVETIRAQRREREARLMTGDAVAATIAHEVKQPLSAMITRADTGFRWLDRSMPNLDKARAEFKQIVADGHRAGALIESIRTNFKKDVRIRTSLDVKDLIWETVALVRDDLQNHRILLKVELDVQALQIIGDRIQLQQVLLNLITNAIDSMGAEDGPRVLCVRTEVHDDGGVVVSVEDTGTGISSLDVERVFDPLFTTKSGGMGMGLSICRSIIEAHDGHLWLVPNTPRGAVFQFVLRPAMTDAGI